MVSISSLLTTTNIIAVIVVLFALIILSSSIRIVKEYERGVIFRLGRLVGAKGPGIFLIIPILDKMVRVNLRTRTMDVPAQEVITKDNVSVRVNAVVYFRVLQPEDAVVEVDNFIEATSQISQTILRGTIGKAELDTLLSEREKLNSDLQEQIDEATDPWGIKVTSVEVKDVEIPEKMKRAMAKQAEAERNRRARITLAEAEQQASMKLSEAAEIMSKNPAALQLRMMQTISDVAAENASTVVLPLPMEILKTWAGVADKDVSFKTQGSEAKDVEEIKEKLEDKMDEDVEINQSEIAADLLGGDVSKDLKDLPGTENLSDEDIEDIKKNLPKGIKKRMKSDESDESDESD